MQLKQLILKANEARRAQAKAQRDSQEFLFTWRSTGAEIVVGYSVAAARLGMKESSLRSRLAHHRNQYHVTRVNPVTSELDVLTITRRQIVKPKKPVGRPPKQHHLDPRLGSEAATEVRPKRRR